MSSSKVDLPPDLPRLRIPRTWRAMWVQRLDGAIAEAERREAERIRGEQARPPAPDWLIERGNCGLKEPFAPSPPTTTAFIRLLGTATLQPWSSGCELDRQGKSQLSAVD
ncbi:hypothetical protein [Streptomyces atriruber]|uniref:hypothetical protein n=1 Tax=Streptomyces atriruber TaxID=545121 RepID=UPI0012FF3B3D|nr:hypothetical protein [Streptomyces atriruber]